MAFRNIINDTQATLPRPGGLLAIYYVEIKYGRNSIRHVSQDRTSIQISSPNERVTYPNNNFGLATSL